MDGVIWGDMLTDIYFQFITGVCSKSVPLYLYIYLDSKIIKATTRFFFLAPSPPSALFHVMSVRFVC